MLDAEAVTRRAGTGRVIEREQARFEFREAVAAQVAGEAVGEDDFFLIRVVHPRDPRDAVRNPESRLERLGEPQTDILLHPEAVHDRLDGVFPAQVEFRRLIELVHFAVDAGPDESLRHEVLHQLYMFALALIHDGRKQHQPRALGHRQHLVDHLAHRLCFERGVVVGAARDACAGKQQSQVVVDLGHRADGRARVVRSGFLLDGDRRR